MTRAAPERGGEGARAAGRPSLEQGPGRTQQAAWSCVRGGRHRGGWRVVRGEAMSGKSRRIALQPRALSALAATALLLGLAAAQLPRVPLAPYPRLAGPRLTIEVQAAATRDELLATFTAPLERKLLALPGVEGLDSSTEDGEARLRLRGEFAGRGGDLEAERLRLAVERIAGTLLPAGTVHVELAPADQRPLLELAVLGRDATARTAFARGVVVPELLRTGAAERIEVVGATPLRVVVRPLPAALAARGLTVGDLVAYLRRLGTTTILGRVREGAAARPLVLGEEVVSLAALRALRLPAVQGAAALGDVATVALHPLGGGDGFLRDGTPAVLVGAFAARSANAVWAGRELRHAAEALAARPPAGLELRLVAAGDGRIVAHLVRLLAAAFAAAAVLVFYSWRRRSLWATMAVAAVPPLAVVVAALSVALLGWPLDPVALGALSTVAGVLAWPALAGAESYIQARWRETGDREGPRESGQSEGEGACTSSGDAWAGAGHPALAAAVVMAAAWVPLAYLKGAALALGGGAAIAVAAAIASALLLAWLLARSVAGVPPPAASASQGSTEGPALQDSEDASRVGGAMPRAGLALPRRGFAGAVRALAVRPLSVLLIALALLALGAAGLVNLARRQHAVPLGPEVEITYQLPPSLAAEESLRLGERLAANVVRALPAPPRHWSWQEKQVGCESGPEANGELRLELATPEAARATAAAARQALAAMADAHGQVRVAPDGWLAGAAGTGALEVLATAPTPGTSQALARRTLERLRASGIAAETAGAAAPAMAGAAELRVALQPFAPESGVRTDVAAALGGFDAGTVIMPGVEPGIRLLAATTDAELGLAPVRTDGGTGHVVPLRALASIKETARTMPFEHRDGKPVTRLSLRASAGRIGNLERALGATTRAAGERLELGGPVYQLARASADLRRVLAFAALLVLAALVVVTDSLWSAAMGFLTLLLAWAGGIAGALAAGPTWAEGPALALGLVLLSGIAPQPALLLCRRAEALRRSGWDAGEALGRAARESRGALLAGLVAAIAAPVAAAAASSVDGGMVRPLIAIMVGGLGLAVASTLLLMPLVLKAWHRLARARAAREES